MQRIHSIKTPLVNFTKHGFVVLQLPEPSGIIRFSSTEVILQSGDVHPQPGPASNHHNDVSERTRRVIYSSSELIHYGKNTGNPSIDQDLKLHLRNLGILNTCNYFSKLRIFDIKTIIHSRRNSSIATDLVAITESWLHSDVDDSLLSISVFNLSREE